MLEKDSALWAAAGAAVAALGGVLARWWERGDKRQDREAAERALREANIYDRQKAEIEACHRRVRELEGDIGRIEVDRDHGWDKARAIYDMLRDEHHLHMDNLQIAMGGRAGAEALRERASPSIPPFTAIVPRDGR